jgi:hypothetical protein
MKAITQATLAAIGLLPLSIFADQGENTTNPIRESRVIAELAQGKKASGKIDAMMPFYGTAERMWYANFQAYQNGQQYGDIGLGLGYRGIVDNAIYGAYGFYDHQRSPEKKSFHRLNVGIERLGESFDVRMNTYIYLGTKRYEGIDHGIQNTYIQGTNLLSERLFVNEEAYNGASLELGHTLGMQNLRGYLGYYAFGGKINGASARLNYQVSDRVSLVASTQHDSARGWLTSAGLQYWFGTPRTLSGKFDIRSRMRDEVQRDLTTASVYTPQELTYEVDPRSIYFASPDAELGGDGKGSEANPLNINDAIALAGENDFIYLVGGSNPTHLLDGTYNLKSGQTLWGGAQDLVVNGFVVRASDASITPTLEGQLNLADNNFLGGFNMLGSGQQYAIYGNNVSGGQITHVNISGNFTDSPLSLNNSSNITLSNMAINSTASQGVVFNNATGIDVSSLSIAGTYATPNTLSGLNSTSASSTNLAAALSIVNGSNVSLQDTRINAEAAKGLYIDASTANVNTLNLQGTYAEEALSINNNSQGSLIDANINTSAATAFVMRNNSNWSFDGLTLKGAYSDNVLALDNVSDINFANLTLSNTLTGESALSINDSQQVNIGNLVASGTYNGAVVNIANSEQTSLNTADINATASQGVNVNNSGVDITGLTLQGAYSGAAVNIDGNANTAGTIKDLTISNASASSAVLLNNTQDWTLSNLTINGDYANNIIQLSNVSNVSLEGTNVLSSVDNGTAEAGIAINTGSTNVSLSGLTLDGTYSVAGVYLDGTDGTTSATISDSNITNHNDAGIYVFQDSHLILNDTTVKSDAQEGLYVNQNSSVEATNIIASNNGITGVRINNASTATLSNIEANNNGSKGLFLQESDVTVNGAIVDNNIESGIIISNDGVNERVVNINDVLVSGNKHKLITDTALTATGDTLTVNLAGDNQLVDYVDGLYAASNAVVHMTGGVIRNNSDEAVRAENGGIVNITDPTTLQGQVVAQGASEVNINVGGLEQSVTGNKTLQCEISDGKGACTP